MGILDKARRLAEQDKKTGDLTWDDSRGWRVVRGQEADDLPDKFEDHVLEGLRRNPVVAACVREMQTSISEAPIHVFDDDEDKNTRIKDHPLEELFKQPNRRDSYVTFIERSVQHFLLGGNSFWFKLRENGVPTMLVPIRPDLVTGAQTDSHNFPSSFTILKSADSTEEIEVPFDDIVHIPDADPLNEVFGMPRVLSATLDIATDNEASNYVNEVLGNFGSPGTIVTIDSERAKRSMLERAEALWQQKFGPGRGRGKVAFIPGGQQVHQVGFNLRDLEFEALRQVTRESIAASFGIDPMVINISTAGRGGTMSGNEHKEARRKLWTQTLIPMIRRWEAAINAFLTPEFGNVHVRFNLENVTALQEDRDNQIDRARKMVQAGASMEEARQEMGLEPDPDPEDHFVLTGRTDIFPVSLITEIGARRDEIQDAVDGDGDNGSGDDGSDDDDDGSDDDEESDQNSGPPSPLSVLRKDLLRWMRENPPLNKKSGPLSPGEGFTPDGSLVRENNTEDEDRAWKQVDGFARSQEAGYRLAAEDIFEKQRRDVLRIAIRVLEEGDSSSSSSDYMVETKQVDPDSVEELRDELEELYDRYDDEWQRRFEPLYEQSADSVAARLSGVLGVGLTLNEFVRRFIRVRLDGLVELNQRTKEGVFAVLSNIADNDISFQNSLRNIQSVFDEGTTYTSSAGKKITLLGVKERSELVARTESTEITNGSALNMAKGTAIDWLKLWLSMRDNKVRPSHAAEDDDSHAQPVPQDEPFRVTGRDFPGGWNCRCTILFRQPKNEETP